MVKGNRLVNGHGQDVRLLGVDVTGTEDACVSHNRVSWGPLTKKEARVIARWGADAVRVPLNEDCWLGLNGLPKRYSSHHYQSSIERWVSDLNSVGMIAILDLHWSAPTNLPATGQWPMPDESHAVTFWSDVAARFKSDKGVLFDLFNEPALGLRHPSQSDWICWLRGCTAPAKLCSESRTPASCSTQTFRVAGMQQLVDTVRATGARQPIMVGGLNWAGDPCGIYDVGGNGGSCMWLQYRPVDPDAQLVVSFHNYNKTVCNSMMCWDSSVAPVAQHFPVVTGEVGDNNCSPAFVTSYMQWADEHGVSYLVWAWQLAHATATCAKEGIRLVTTWTGRTNKANAAASAAQIHLHQELRRQVSDV